MESVSNDKTNNRRSFLKTAGAAGAALLGSGTALAQGFRQPPPPPPRRETPIRVGAVGLDYSFWGIWGGLINGRSTGTHLLNMEVTCVWDKNPQTAQRNAQMLGGAEVVESYDDMLGKVDCVANGGLYNAPWQHLIMKPYIEAGIPCLLMRPWSSCMRDMDTMLELIAKYDTPVMATTPYEHYDVALNFGRKLQNLGQIQAAFATCEANDRPHFHLPYMMMKMLGYNVTDVAMVTDDPKRASYLQSTYIFGGSDDQRPFPLTVQAHGNYTYSFHLYGQNGVETESMPSEASQSARFMPQLIDFQKTIDSGAQFEPLDNVRRKFEVLIAEYYSHYEKGGAPVKVGSVPMDWQYPLWREDWYTDDDFKS